MQDYVKIRVLSFDSATTDGEDALNGVHGKYRPQTRYTDKQITLDLNGRHVVPGGRLRALETSKLGLREVLWRPNDFPYALEEGIHHDLVWCRTPLSTEELAQVMIIFPCALSTGIEHMLDAQHLKCTVTHVLSRLVHVSFQ